MGDENKKIEEKKCRSSFIHMVIEILIFVILIIIILSNTCWKNNYGEIAPPTETSVNDILYQYIGEEILGVNVNSLLNSVISHNSIKTNKPVEIDVDSSLKKPIVENKNNATIRIIEKAEAGKYYNVSVIKYDNSGDITKIKIEKGEK